MLKAKFGSLLVIGVTSLLFDVTWAQTFVTPLAKSPPPIAAEKNPPGDIPDNQAFVEYRSPLGFSIKVPEGWARREQLSDVSFRDKYNHLQVEVSAQPSAPTIASIKANQLSTLEKLPKAIRIASVEQIQLPAGAVVVANYGANSDANAVTNKAIRLESASYYFWKAGKLATLTLSAPAGADNVDQWQLISKSFAWR
jgi:hypothetical protein